MSHRIQRLTPEGEVLAQWGEFSGDDDGAHSGGTFNEPWGLEVAPDGTVYVADTWNHRVQKFTPEGQFLESFGYFGQAETIDALWAPREVVFDERGSLFVADTGNKRIVVFDANGQPVASFGGPGASLGRMDEPVGLALNYDDALVYVADTWNQRIQAFLMIGETRFEAVGEWPIDGWIGQSLDNKPYLAVRDDGLICASDPEKYRVLCFWSDGRFALDGRVSGVDEAQLGLVSGVAFDGDGRLWLVDASNDRLMRFELAIQE